MRAIHSREIFIISDLHLFSGLAQPIRVRRFLDTIPESATIIVNGDFIHDGAELASIKLNESEIVRSLVQRTNTFFIRGNHDMPPVTFSELFGKQLHDELILHIQGKRFLVMHGHTFDALTDGSFESIKKTAQAAWALIYRILKHIPLQRSILCYARKAFEATYHRLAPLRKKAARYAAEKGYDGVIIGHEHASDHTAIKGILYYNCGSWVKHRPCTYLQILNNQIHIRTFE